VERTSLASVEGFQLRAEVVGWRPEAGMVAFAMGVEGNGREVAGARVAGEVEVQA
jgi:hypothetical protein